MNNNILGKIGEQIAKKYLIDKGFEFITENYFTIKGEIDLIFKENETLIFVEVKTRKNKKYWENAFGFQKVKHLRASAEIFIEKQDISFIEMQFDVIFILLDHKNTVVEIGHRPNFV
ncbi:MAG: YraN family protein [Brevinema sp.]